MKAECIVLSDLGLGTVELARLTAHRESPKASLKAGEKAWSSEAAGDLDSRVITFFSQEPLLRLDKRLFL